MTLGSVRYHAIIERSADDVWALVGAPERLHEWFPGIDASPVEGNVRTIRLGTGIELPEDILTNDSLLRRFQYGLSGGLVSYHRGTIDVLPIDDDSCMVVYATDADPRTMALTIGAGTAGALDELKRQMEGDQ